MVAKADIKPQRHIRRFDIFAEYRKQAQESKGVDEDEAMGYGLWVAMPTADVIFHERETSPLHRGHIILHELCHLLSGHRPAPISREEAARLLLPDLQPDEWTRFVCVESGNVGARAVTLAPGARHRLGVALRSDAGRGV